MEDLMKYFAGCQPDLELQTFEVSAFLAFRKEVGDVLSYRGRIPHLRNHHRYAKRVLDALVVNWQDRSKKRPLRLIVATASDHNGYMHHTGWMSDAVAHPSHVALVVEATGSLEEVQGLFAPLAEAYGQGGKIDDLILTGHGNSTLMILGSPVDLARGRSAPAEEADPTRVPQKAHFMLVNDESDPESAAFTRRFFASAIEHMKADPAHPAAIALMSCHSGSANSVYVNHEKGPARDRTRELFVKQSSISKMLSAEAKHATSPIRVIAPTQYAFPNDIVVDAKTGALSPLNARDPASYSPNKLDYVSRGTNLPDVFAAVQLAWVDKRAELAGALHQRLERPVASPWEPLLQAMFKLLLPQIENPRVVNDMHELAHDVQRLADGVVNWPSLRTMPNLWRGPLYKGLSLCPVWQLPAAHLPFLQSWMIVDASKDAEFMAFVGAMHPRELAKYVYPRLLEPILPRLLHNAVATPAELKLALALVASGLDEGPIISAGARAYLVKLLGGHEHFEGSFKDALPDGYTEAEVLGAIGKGKGVRIAPPPSMFSTVPIGKPALVKVATTLRTGPNDAYAVDEKQPGLAVGAQVVVDRELRVNDRIPAQRWFYVLTPYGGGWMLGNAVELATTNATSASLGAAPSLRPGDTRAPIRVLVTGFSDPTAGVADPSQRIAQAVAGVEFPGAIVTTKILRGSFRAIDAFVEHELREGHMDVVLSLGRGQAGLMHGIKDLALNRAAGPADADGVTRGGEPILPQGDLLASATLPLGRILADQKRIGAGGLSRQAYVGTEDTSLGNYLEYRQLQTTQGAGAMVGFVSVIDAQKDQPGVLQVIRSAIEEVRARRERSHPERSHDSV